MDVDKLEAGRELDALVAEQLFGWQWALFDQAFTEEATRTLVSPDSSMLEKPASGQEQRSRHYHCGVPHYSADIAAAWEVEEVIEQRGLNLRYTQALIAVLVSEGLAPEHDEELWWALIHASPYQRCCAALKAISNGHP